MASILLNARRTNVPADKRFRQKLSHEYSTYSSCQFLAPPPSFMGYKVPHRGKYFGKCSPVKRELN